MGCTRLHAVLAGIDGQECVFGDHPEPEVMAHDGESNIGALVTTDRDPGACAPMVDPAVEPLQAPLKPFAILAKIMQKASERSLLAQACRSPKGTRERLHALEMGQKGMACANFVFAVREIHDSPNLRGGTRPDCTKTTSERPTRQ